MAAPLILARTFKDAHKYAQDELGLRIGYYRVVNSPGTIKAVRGVDIHLVPGWDKRPDRFTMKGALRYCRLNIIDVAEQREAAAAFDAAMPPTPDVTNGDLMVAEGAPEPAPIDEAEPEIVMAEDNRSEAAEAEEPTPEQPAEPAKRRRRTRCKDCGTLHFREEECPS